MDTNAHEFRSANDRTLNRRRAQMMKILIFDVAADGVELAGDEIDLLGSQRKLPVPLERINSGHLMTMIT